MLFFFEKQAVLFFCVVTNPRQSSSMLDKLGIVMERRRALDCGFWKKSHSKV